jgi:hypothetical protein
VATIVGVAVSLVLISWLMVSVLAQLFDGLGARLSFASKFGLIPAWRFFAPRPGMDDMHLLYRDRHINQMIGTARCVRTIDDRRWYHLVWNPKKFHNKVLSDQCRSLRRHLRHINQEGFDSRVIMLSTPYIVILHLVMRMPHRPDAEARQFILATEKSFAEDPDQQIVFMSEFHRFDTLR